MAINEGNLLRLPRRLRVPHGCGANQLQRKPARRRPARGGFSAGFGAPWSIGAIDSVGFDAAELYVRRSIRAVRDRGWLAGFCPAIR